MSKERSILIVFPDEWLQYSPSVQNLYQCCKKNYYTKLVYVDNGRFKNQGIVDHSSTIKIGKTAAYFWRKTLGYKFYKVFRLFFLLLRVKLFDRKYDHVIAIDSSGYLPTKLLFPRTAYFSLETEKDVFYRWCKRLGIETLLIQSKERAAFMIDEGEEVAIYYLQNSPILDEHIKRYQGPKEKRILYMGNIEFGYGLEHFIDCVKDLEQGYTLTLKGIKNEKYFQWLRERYRDIIASGKLRFDFEYVDQSKIIEYVSQYYIGITGYDLELAKKSFNYFSSPAGKLFNYYAAGVPVIGIDIVGLKSATDFHAGVLMEAVSSENIRRAIKTIEEDYARYAANCLRAADEFDFKKGFDTFISDLEKKTPGRATIKSYLTQGHERSVKTKQNIFGSILIKCFSIAISFLLIPLTLKYLDTVNFGIWLTITSVIGWFTFFDLGIGNGLSNKLTAALAKNDIDLARTYVSTAYAIMLVIISAVFVLFTLVFPLINWTTLLNTPPEIGEEISQLIFIVFSFFCLQFVVKLISVVLKADQRSALSGGINTFASLLSLIIVFILTQTKQSSLLWLTIGISSANIIAPLVASFWFFGRNYKQIAPSFKYIKFGKARDLMSLGLQFFIMQFAALILFSTDTFIIDQLYGPEEVVPYNIAYKYFSIVTMGFAIITTPFWAAYADAYHKNDLAWIHRITRKLSLFWGLLVIAVLGMLLFANIFYELWIGKAVQIPFSLSASMALWVLISSWTTIFGNFLNGVEKIRLSLYHSIAMILINIPLCIFLARYLNMGSTGVIIGTCLCVLPQVFLHPIQYKKIISNTARGIWAR